MVFSIEVNRSLEILRVAFKQFKIIPVKWLVVGGLVLSTDSEFSLVKTDWFVIVKV